MPSVVDARGRVLVGLLVLCSALGGQAPFAAAADEPLLPPLLLEMQSGPGAPLGGPAASLAGRVHPRIWVGAGIGSTPERVGEHSAVAGVFARVLVVDARYWTFWFSGGAARWSWDHGSHAVYENEVVTRTPYVWEGAGRVFAGFGMHLWAGTRAVRLEGGMGYRLGAADSCGGCPDPSGAPGDARMAPYLVVGVAQAFGRARPDRDPLAPVAPGLEVAREEDPFVHAAFASPTALGQPAGAQLLAVAAFPLPVPALVLGHHDRWQTTFHVLSGLGWSAGALTKVRVTSGTRWHLALLGGALGITGDHQSHWLLAGAGAVASCCLDRGCRSLASVYGGAGYLDDDPEDAPRVRRAAAVTGASVVVSVWRHLKLLAEGHAGERGPFRMPLAMVGARLPTHRWAFELGALIRRTGAAPFATAGWRW